MRVVAIGALLDMGYTQPLSFRLMLMFNQNRTIAYREKE